MNVLSEIGKIHRTSETRTDEVLVKVLTTSIQMLQDRGCVNLQACQSVEEITQCMLEGRRVITATSASGSERIDVYFHNEERVGVKQLRLWTEGRVQDKTIIVSLDGPTAFTRKEAETMGHQVQFFTFLDLSVNITRHALVPVHEKVTRAMVPVSLTASCSELPILASTDKVAQYYAYEPGDIIRITRTVGTQEPVYYYRIVKNIGAVA